MAEFDVTRLGEVFVVFVDDEDVELVRQSKWFIGKNGYVRSNSQGYLHRLVMRAVVGDPFVDHRDRNRLNNRKDNLRFISKSDSTHNKTVRRQSTTGFRGVMVYQNRTKPYAARVTVGGVQHDLGYFTTAEEAGEAARVARLALMTYAES